MAADRRQKLPRRKGCGTNSRKCRIRRSGGRNAGLWQREPHPRFLWAGSRARARRALCASTAWITGARANAAGTFTAVVFDPGHLSLVKGSPEGRRRFLDAALCQLYPGYVTLLRRYSRLVTQKNALLKSYWQTPDANGLLDVFDEKLAESGAAVSAKKTGNILRSSSRRSRGHTGTSPAAAKRWPFSTSRLSSRKKGLAPVLQESRARDIAADRL